MDLYSVVIKNTLSKTLAECTETDGEAEAKQTGCKCFGGYAGAVVHYRTDEYSKVNRTPEAEQIGRTGFGRHSGTVAPSSTNK